MDNIFIILLIHINRIYYPMRNNINIHKLIWMVSQRDGSSKFSIRLTSPCFLASFLSLLGYWFIYSDCGSFESMISKNLGVLCIYNITYIYNNIIYIYYAYRIDTCTTCFCRYVPWSKVGLAIIRISIVGKMIINQYKPYTLF